MDNVEELKREIEALKERVREAERRARADLEALIDTSPIGVVVFDATTGWPQSINREAQRIVGGLNIPGHSMEQQLEVITCRFQGRA